MGTATGFSPLLIGGRARGAASPRRRAPGAPFQSPSHRGPRARRMRRLMRALDLLSFSPLLIGGRARGSEYDTGDAVFDSMFQSPSHRGPRARQDQDRGNAGDHKSFSPLLIGGRARGHYGRI